MKPLHPLPFATHLSRLAAKKALGSFMSALKGPAGREGTDTATATRNVGGITVSFILKGRSCQHSRALQERKGRTQLQQPGMWAQLQFHLYFERGRSSLRSRVKEEKRDTITERAQSQVESHSERMSHALRG